MLIGTLASGLPTRKTHDVNRLPRGRGTAWQTWILPPAAGPQAFLVEQEGDSFVSSHFHTVPQFQVVVQGNGAIGSHAVAPVHVHYARAYTGYGPLRAGPEGLSYATLRARTDPHPALFLPERKDDLMPGVRENVFVAVDGDASCVQAIAPRADGVAAWMLRVAPGARVPCPVSDSGTSQFRLVLRGAMLTETAVLGRLGCAFALGAEMNAEITAGTEPLEVLVLQFGPDGTQPAALEGAKP